MMTHDENIARQADRLITISDGKIISDEKNCKQYLYFSAVNNNNIYKLKYDF